MPQFKIFYSCGSKCSGRYLGEEKKFDFKNQSSEPLPSFTMYQGTQVEIEFDAVKERPVPGQIVDVDGSWYNFTKKKPVPEMVFCVTKIISII